MHLAAKKRDCLAQHQSLTCWSYCFLANTEVTEQICGVTHSCRFIAKQTVMTRFCDYSSNRNKPSHSWGCNATDMQYLCERWTWVGPYTPLLPDHGPTCTYIVKVDMIHFVVFLLAHSNATQDKMAALIYNKDNVL
jgi:hypothetical protein